MRLATIAGNEQPVVALVRGNRLLPLTPAPLDRVPASLAVIAAGGPAALADVRRWADHQPAAGWRSLATTELAPAVPAPGAIYAIGRNYHVPDDPAGPAPERPLVYGKAPGSVGAHGATLAWDRSLTAKVDAEVELGVVIGSPAFGVGPADAMRHVFGYTIVNDVSSRDPWLDGDQWLLGKSMPGFCPVGPWIVTADELDPTRLRLGCTINGEPIQDGTTLDMRFHIADLVAFLSRHVALRPGDLIATGTPARLRTPPGPDRRLEPGDVVTAWIEGVGELTTTIG